MAEKDPEKKKGRKIALDGDKLGHVVGTTVALAVMAICFYFQKVDGVTAAVRVGWAFVIGYGATFFLVRVILRTTLFEFVQHERELREAHKVVTHLGSGEEEEERANVEPAEPEVGEEPGPVEQ